MGSGWFPVLWMPLLAMLMVGAVATPLLEPAGRGLEDAGPDGLDTFRSLTSGEGYDVSTTLISPAAAGGMDPESTLLILLDPATPYTPREAAWAATWLGEGGRLLIADGTAGTGTVGEELGVPVSARRIFQAAVGGGEATRVAATLTLEGTQHDLVLQAPLPISRAATEEGPVEALARSGPSSFLDLNGNERLDEQDTRGPFVVGAGTAEGRAIVLTSGWILTDDGLSVAGNREAVRALLGSLLPDGGRVVVDLSHAPRAPGIAQATRAVGLAAALPQGVVAGTLSVVVVAVATGVFVYGRSEGDTSWQVGGPPVDDVTAPARDPPREAMARNLARIQAEGRTRTGSRLAAKRQAVEEAIEKLDGEDPPVSKRRRS